MNGGKPVRIDIQVPPDRQAGVYANQLAVWHTDQEFTLDFCQSQPAREDGPEVVVDWLVVGRVKIPPTLVFEVLKAMNENLGKYEQVFGEITKPGPKGGGSS